MTNEKSKNESNIDEDYSIDDFEYEYVLPQDTYDGEFIE